MADTTVCIRCGKPRIVAKSWSESAAGSPVTYTLTVCPDAACQKIVDSELKKKLDKIMVIQKKSAERRKAIKKRNPKKKR